MKTEGGEMAVYAVVSQGQHWAFSEVSPAKAQRGRVACTTPSPTPEEDRRRWKCWSILSRRLRMAVPENPVRPGTRKQIRLRVWLERGVETRRAQKTERLTNRLCRGTPVASDRRDPPASSRRTDDDHPSCRGKVWPDSHPRATSFFTGARSRRAG
jgi:hypothetical protein